MKAAMHFEMYKAWYGLWRWRLRGINGEIIASGQPYKREADCIGGISLVKHSGKAQIERL